jgi:hypothetical protein
LLNRSSLHCLKKFYATDSGTTNTKYTALVLMDAYHICFDLSYYGFVSIDFNNTPFWLGAHALIVTLFLL